MQLVQLQERQREFDREGWAIIAISYDDVPTLATFASRHGITYPLLSDDGSHVIRSLGLENQHVIAQHAFYFNDDPELNREAQGSAYPGTFVLDPAGLIVEKRFEQSYRVRESAGALAERLLNTHPKATIKVERQSPGVRISAWTTVSGYWSFQQFVVHVTLELDAGCHAYGRPIPEGYKPLAIKVGAPTHVGVSPVSLPEPHPFEMVGLDEQFMVYDGVVDVPITITVHSLDVAPVLVSVTADYQVCGETFCYAPARAILDLEIPALDLVV